MNKIFKSSVLLAPYLYLVFCVLIFTYWDFTWIGVPILIGYLLILVAVFIPNIIYTSVLSRRSDVSAEELLDFAAHAKRMHISFYVIIFLLGVVCAMTVFGIAFIPVLFVMDYVLMMTTTAYSNCGIRKAVSDGKLSKKDGLVCKVMNFIFVLDLVGTVKVCKKIKTN
jgi:fatty acid desaturase